MKGYDETTYGDRIAEVYDDWYGDRFDVEATVDLLVELAWSGRALELAIGTGRVALPLAARGVPVVGIDASEAMVARMRAKPGGADIPVVMGNFVDVAVEGTFSLVYLPFTTLFALPSQESQLQCLRNVAAHLEPGGHFVMDAFVPDAGRLAGRSHVSVMEIDADHVLLDVSRHDPVDQRIDSAHVVLSVDGGVKLYPVAIRYAWPAELDALALSAGLHLENRWGDYDRSPFGPHSDRHVSVYRRG